MVVANSWDQLTTQSPMEHWDSDCAEIPQAVAKTNTESRVSLCGPCDLQCDFPFFPLRPFLCNALLGPKIPLGLTDRTAFTKLEGRSLATSAFAIRRENWGYDLFTRFDNRIGLYSAPVQQKQQIGFVFLVAKRFLQRIQR
jgi:hypothetical protein